MNLVYLVAVGELDDRFLDSVRWCVHSLRAWGRFEDEIVVLTDAGGRLRRRLGEEARLLEVDRAALFDPDHGRSAGERYQMARLTVADLLDLRAYGSVMYLDADVLAVRDIRPLFEDVKEFRYAREFQPMSGPGFSASLTDAELDEARWRRGINSGVFVAPGHYLPECLGTWRRALDEEPDGACYDQPALNAIVLRAEIRARALPSLSVAYPVFSDFPLHFRPQTRLLHYCGHRDKKFARMKRHFEALERGRPIQVHFGLDEDLEPAGAVRRRSPSAGLATPLRIGIDHDLRGVESHALINREWERQLSLRGHRVLAPDSEELPHVVLHHNFERDFSEADLLEGVPHVAVRTSDFGPHPRQWVERINRHYEQLWVHTEWVRQHALEGGVDAARIRIVPHGVDPLVFRPVGADFPLPTEKRFRFLFVGGAVARKGIDILLEAYCREFAPDEDVCLVVKDHGANVFYRDHPHRERLQQLARDERTPELLYLDRHLSAEELASLYRACSVGVWPYRAEGFLIPALECMACGTPTVLPEVGPTADFSNARTSFLVPVVRIRLPFRRRFRMRLGFEVDIEALDFVETRVEELARKLREAFESGSLALGEKAAASVALAHGRFTWAHAGDRIEACLAELLGAERDGGRAMGRATGRSAA